MTRDWQNEPMTPEEEDAWDEHERYLVEMGQHDRAAHFESKQKAHELNRAVCEALATMPPWED